MPEPQSLTDDWKQRREALLTLGERIRDFRRRPFPVGWAKVVNGVGLASLSMRAEFSLYGVPAFTCVYLDAHHYPESVVLGLSAIIESCDRALPGLPADPASYFRELRSLAHDALRMVNAYWPPLPGSRHDRGSGPVRTPCSPRSLRGLPLPRELLQKCGKGGIA